MQRDELIARLDVSMEFQMVAYLTGLIENSKPDVNDLLDLTFHQKKEVCFRAAWMLEHIMVNHPLDFYDHVIRFLELLPQQENPSAMRHYAKIVALMTAKKSSLLYKEVLTRVDHMPIIELLFTWLIDPDVLVATKVHCMQSLANLAPVHTWIKDELLQTIDYIQDLESVAFFARAKMVKRELLKIDT
ncbi:hypothetical protein [Pedobacter metabolipauper]|uniref:HEAT repeat protein n=1 Tax=Pedobacter metabolipauper TaxID=425513 RepID=A0A4R6ST62_9SPHI|nr:hypothetical protein [Pedobacter metabolipauper]TDQ07065.1 hypothetical protein ATK78_4081 [Pedobacter metabolipauper]